MKEAEIIVTARLKVKPGLEERFQAEYLPIIKLTVSEAGCLHYHLYQSQADLSIFMLYEKWTSKEVLDRHLEMPYIKAIGEKAPEFLAEPVEINLWQQIS